MSDLLQTITLDSTLDFIQTLRRFQDCVLPIAFHSAATHRPEDARWSFLTAEPIDVYRINQTVYGQRPFDELRKWQRRLPKLSCEAPPFCGGIAGLMSYDLGHAFERLPKGSSIGLGTPQLLAGMYDWAIVWDHCESTVQLCVLRVDDSDLCQRKDWVLERLQSPISDEVSCRSIPLDIDHLYPLPQTQGVFSTFSKDEYLATVERVIEYIRAGDIFQANLSQQLLAHYTGSACQLFDQVCRHNPAPFAAMIQADDFAVISASPERFLSVKGGCGVETRPIKGTRRRQRSPIADLFTSHELCTSEKDRSENVMIVDLLRNDISRVCQPESVKVTGLCEVEIFETVQHLVSTIVGHLKDSADIWDLCAATIPGGSITGAPKIRAMEIIAELEPRVRGPYCGNMFYVGPNEDFDSNILIRTFTLKNGVVEFPVGGGIVADSDPEAEYMETLHKAAAMLNTLQTDVSGSL